MLAVKQTPPYPSLEKLTFEYLIESPTGNHPPLDIHHKAEANPHLHTFWSILDRREYVYRNLPRTLPYQQTDPHLLLRVDREFDAETVKELKEKGYKLYGLA